MSIQFHPAMGMLINNNSFWGYPTALCCFNGGTTCACTWSWSPRGTSLLADGLAILINVEHCCRPLSLPLGHLGHFYLRQRLLLLALGNCSTACSTSSSPLDSSSITSTSIWVDKDLMDAVLEAMPCSSWKLPSETLTSLPKQSWSSRLQDSWDQTW